MARYPIFKNGEEVKILPSISEEIDSGIMADVLRILEDNAYMGEIYQRLPRGKRNRPIYSVLFTNGPYSEVHFSIYANHLEKITIKEKK